MLIYHIVLPDVWDDAKFKTFYEAASLAAEGFIHCSYKDQLEGVIDRYYADAKALVILSIDSNLLTSPLVSEPSTNNEPYPHIYGPINVDAVINAEKRPSVSV